MKTVCETCGKVIDSYDALTVSGYGRMFKKYDGLTFCSVGCASSFFSKEDEEHKKENTDRKRGFLPFRKKDPVSTHSDHREE